MEVSTYLGIAVSRWDNGKIKLSQPSLMDKVINKCGLKVESKAHKTLASSIWYKNYAETQQYTWSYHQVIGMLNYIAATTCPNISFAVHQCIWFSQEPKRSHELTVTRILWYHKGTRNDGYILQSNDNHTLDCYADADFAGVWSPEESDDPRNVHSRSGYVITYSGFPIL